MVTAQPPTLAPATAADEDVDIDDAALADLQRGGIKPKESLRIAFGSLVANKLRSLLTALGVIIGVAAVVALLAIGNGSQASITASITANGANLLTVRPGAPSTGGVGGQVGSAQTLTTADAQALANPQNVPDASQVSAEYTSNAQLVEGNQNLNARVTGAQPTYLALHNLTLADGDFISDNQLTSNSNVVVLGANVATKLFPDGGSVGKLLRINGQSFQVLGVLNAQGGSGFGSVDDGVVVPLSTAQRKLFGGRAIGNGGSPLVSTIVVQAKDQNSVNATLDEVNATLRDQHHLPANGSADDFSVINQQDILATATQTTQVLTLFLAAIAGISLLVGGIGIMNIMLVSVRERTREIGLRKAIGARENDILFQFLIEALSLSLVGGLIGVVLGAAIAEGVSLAGVMKAVIAPTSVVLALGFAMAVGLFFGIAPARSAARLDPIEALRQD